MFVEIHKIEPNKCVEELFSWYEKEKKNVRKRFGSDEEAFKYWPDDYYEKMEMWWGDPENRSREPIVVAKRGEIYEIVDGFHRFVISYKLGLKLVPVMIVV